MSTARWTSVFFAFAAAAFVGCGVYLSILVGASVADLWTSPVGEFALVFLVPAAVSIVCAAVLWRGPRRATTVHALQASCVAAVIGLFAFGWIAIAITLGGCAVLLWQPALRVAPARQDRTERAAP